MYLDLFPEGLESVPDGLVAVDGLDPELEGRVADEDREPDEEGLVAVEECEVDDLLETDEREPVDFTEGLPVEYLLVEER